MLLSLCLAIPLFSECVEPILSADIADEHLSGIADVHEDDGATSDVGHEDGRLKSVATTAAISVGATPAGLSTSAGKRLSPITWDLGPNDGDKGARKSPAGGRLLSTDTRQQNGRKRKDKAVRIGSGGGQPPRPGEQCSFGMSLGVCLGKNVPKCLRLCSGKSVYRTQVFALHCMLQRFP